MSFIEELRSLEPESSIIARKMLEKLKYQIKEKVRSGATGQISDSIKIHSINPKLEWPMISKTERTKLKKTLFQRKNKYTVRESYSLKQYILDAMPYLQQYAKEDGIILSDPYIVLHDLQLDGGKYITYRESSVTYEYIDEPGLDGWEQRVYANAYVDYSITI